jgi:hypothetical protein
MRGTLVVVWESAGAIFKLFPKLNAFVGQSPAHRAVCAAAFDVTRFNRTTERAICRRVRPSAGCLVIPAAISIEAQDGSSNIVRNFGGSVCHETPFNRRQSMKR